MAKRWVVIDEQYLDGIQEYQVSKPTKYHREVVQVDKQLLYDYYQLQKAQGRMQERLRQALAEAPRRRNRKYKEDDDATS